MAGKRCSTRVHEVPTEQAHTSDTEICPACKLHREHTPEVHAVLVRRERNVAMRAKMNEHTCPPRTRSYAQRECLTCGQVIHESAYSGKDGNFRKHLASHEQ